MQRQVTEGREPAGLTLVAGPQRDGWGGPGDSAKGQEMVDPNTWSNCKTSLDVLWLVSQRKWGLPGMGSEEPCWVRLEPKKPAGRLLSKER